MLRLTLLHLTLALQQCTHIYQDIYFAELFSEFHATFIFGVLFVSLIL